MRYAMLDVDYYWGIMTPAMHSGIREMALALHPIHHLYGPTQVGCKDR